MNRAARLLRPGRSGAAFLLFAGLSFFLLLMALLGVAIGPTGIRFKEIIAVLLGHGGDPTTTTIILQVRLPRVLVAGAAGATLGLGGLVLQALLRNPLAEPYILGISGGSAIGAIIGMLLGLAYFPGVTVCALLGSAAVLLLIFVVGMGRFGARNDTLLLSGVMMNAFCGAIIMFLISISRSSQVQQILYWLMGDLSVSDSGHLGMLLLLPPCFIVLFIQARPLNCLVAGREAATAMGIDVRRQMMVALLATTIMVSVVVTRTGLIGFVGLVIPHIFRLLLGADHRRLVPATVLGGGGYLIGCDLLARTLPAQGEMPVGILTAIIGAPLFVLLLWRSR